MTKKELEQLIDLRKEIEELEKSILKIKQMDIGDAPVKVNASQQEFPYLQGKATVRGYDPALVDKQSKRLYEKRILLDERKKKVDEEEKRLTQYINSIEESRVRRIIQYKYVDGYSWEKIGNILHCDRTTVQKLVTRYLEKHN